MIAHETVHLRQQAAGRIGWFLRYVFSRKFRLASEIEAYREQYNFEEKNGYSPDYTDYADALSSRTYFGMISQSEAEKITIEWYREYSITGKGSK